MCKFSLTWEVNNNKLLLNIFAVVADDWWWYPKNPPKYSTNTRAHTHTRMGLVHSTNICVCFMFRCVWMSVTVSVCNMCFNSSFFPFLFDNLVRKTCTAPIIYSYTERKFGFKTKVEKRQQQHERQPANVRHISIDQCMWLTCSYQVWELLQNCQREVWFKSVC